jgi:protein-S-isoprenylcysteine O-methyltransferase Ste14
LIARGIIAGLYIVLTRNLLTDFLSTGRATGLLILVSEFLVLVMTIARRRARTVDLSLASVLTATVSVAGPLLVRAADKPGVLPDLATTLVSGIGLLIIIAGKLALGRSFGIVPANRGVVVSGLYRVVRHPIYAGYLITHVAFALAHPIVRNLSILAVADAALIVRALREERVLAADSEYQAYCRRVTWHFVPGIF